MGQDEGFSTQNQVSESIYFNAFGSGTNNIKKKPISIYPHIDHSDSHAVM